MRSLLLIILMLFTPISALATIKTSDIHLDSLDGKGATQMLLPEIEGWNKEFGYEDKHVKAALDQDLTMAFRYTRDESKVMWVALQISKGKHVWEDSLLYAPTKRGEPAATVIAHKDVLLLKDPPTAAKLFIYKRPNSTNAEAVLYWFERATFIIDSSLQERNVLVSLWNYVSTLQRAGFINDSNNVDEIERFYIDFAYPLAIYWKNMIDNDILTISKLPLIAIPLAVSIGIFIFYTRRGTLKHT